MKILIADDDRSLASALALKCRRFGLDVVTTHDGYSALSLARTEGFDVICLDIEMPGGNGLGVCEMLASDESFSTTPVIILTGRQDTDTQRRCHNLCAYYVPKCVNVWERMKPLLGDLAARQPSRA